MISLLNKAHEDRPYLLPGLSLIMFCSMTFSKLRKILLKGYVSASYQFASIGPNRCCPKNEVGHQEFRPLMLKNTGSLQSPIYV